jgi:hypothetical protein
VNFLKVNQLIPAEGDIIAPRSNCLFWLTIRSTSSGNNLNDIRDFINAQPASTLIGVGYMSNVTVNIVQNVTADQAMAVNALRLPRGSFSTMDSPYLSLITLVKGWRQEKVGREVLMVTDGLDRVRENQPALPAWGPAMVPCITVCPP